VLGVRIQPNHPTDNLAGILLAAVDGLLFGCGDAVIGVNPAAESVETVSAILTRLQQLIETLGVPTQACCLAHVTTQLACLERGLEQHRRRDVPWVGDNVMYFETGQGSALSAEAHHGIDQLTLEARAYGVARSVQPFLVNSVVGFIGPEYLYDERQIIRAGL